VRLMSDRRTIELAARPGSLAGQCDHIVRLQPLVSLAH